MRGRRFPTAWQKSSLLGSSKPATSLFSGPECVRAACAGRLANGQIVGRTSQSMLDTRAFEVRATTGGLMGKLAGRTSRACRRQSPARSPLLARQVKKACE